MQDKEEERALVNVVARLKNEGYTEDFTVRENKLWDTGNGKSWGANDVRIIDFYRFEGESDPDDMSILYVIECEDGSKGTLANSYGTYADLGVETFLKEVELLGKNLIKKDK